MPFKPVCEDLIYRDGRGPELQKVHYSGRGSQIQAVDYYNPDDVYAIENLKCVVFEKPQVFMFTPEEVFKYRNNEINRAEYGRAAILCLGQSTWLQSFSQRHLARCDHYRIMFYDDFLDIICEGIQARAGGFR